MNKLNTFLGAAALTVTLPFSAAAQDTERDFQIPAQFFAQGSIPGTAPQAVPVYCHDDFNWQSNPPRPELELLERIDTLGFGGGRETNVAFLLMDEEQRQMTLNEMKNPLAKTFLQNLAANYDRSNDKVSFVTSLLENNHAWPESRYAEIAAECERQGLGR